MSEPKTRNDLITFETTEEDDGTWSVLVTFPGGKVTRCPGAASKEQADAFVSDAVKRLGLIRQDRH